jgi:two-component system, NarL family, sensor kinase
MGPESDTTRPDAMRPRTAIGRVLGRAAQWRGGTIVRFAVSSAALLVLVVAIGAVALRHLATDEALADARSVTVAFSRGMLRNAITPRVLHGDREAMAALDRRVHQTVLGHPIVRLKVWSPTGRIVYSDAHELIGRRFGLPADLRAAMTDGAVHAEVSDLSRPENRLERGQGKLVEVYLPLRVASGEIVMVEAYHPAERIDAASHRVWRTFLPMLVALLAALAAVQLPLVWAQSRRQRADARAREELALHAERMLQSERGRIAKELHTGIVQDLAGAAYAMHAAAAVPDDAPAAEFRRALKQGAEVCRTSMTRMRSLLVDLSAPADDSQDLEAAIDALAAPLRANGAQVSVAVTLHRPLDGDSALLVHRAAREIVLAVRGVRDVTDVTIELRERDGHLVLTVEHDGSGDTLSARLSGAESHRGGLAARLRERGGSLTVHPRPGAGARIEAALPGTA